MCKYTYTNMIKNSEKKLFSVVSNLQTQYHFKQNFQKWANIQEASG